MTAAASDAYLVSLRAFGDFVIATRMARAVRKLPPDVAALTVFTGDHVRSLARVLGIEDQVQFIPTGTEVPAAFDVRLRGVGKAAVSLLKLRSQMAALPANSELIFHTYGMRERFIGWQYVRHGLVPGLNVYLAFEQTLQALGFGLDRMDRSKPAHGAKLQRARIFPAARMVERCIPGDVMMRVCNQLREHGIDCEVVSLAGESGSVPPQLPVKKIERSFVALSEEIKTCDLVITADSLPGHLADYLDVPAYVLSPIRKEYWLPRSCFTQNAWSLFDDEHAFAKWIASRVHQRSGEAIAAAMPLSERQS